MNLNCAILHADASTARILQEYVDKVPFLSLCGVYSDPLEALKAYYEQKVHLYFIGICPVEAGSVGGMDFSKMLSIPTRVVFVSDTDRYAAECFRLDALDYLTAACGFTGFFHAACKALRWFSLQENATHSLGHRPDTTPSGSFIMVKSENHIVRVVLHDIGYIEGMGDYIKIYCDDPKPIVSLCSMKYIESQLPSDDFMRIHRSYIVRKEAVEMIGASQLVVNGREIPVGDTYRERVKDFVATLSVL